MSRICDWCGGLALASLLLIGCESKPKADYGSLNLMSVGGRITLDGQPLSKAVVTFDDETDGTFSFGLTDTGGNYTLRFDSDAVGVKPGKKIVRISTTRKILGLNTSEGEGGSGGEGGEEATETGGASLLQKEQVPDKYNKKSELRVEVVPSKRSFNFDLVSTPEAGQ